MPNNKWRNVPVITRNIMGYLRKVDKMSNSHRRLTPSKLVVIRISCFQWQFGCFRANLVAFGLELIAFNAGLVALSHLLD